MPPRNVDIVGRRPRARGAETRFIRGALLIAYEEAARRVGLDPLLMLRQADAPASQGQNPGLARPLDRVANLIDAAATATTREAFGLTVGAVFRLSPKGPLHLLLRRQPTVRHAVEALACYLRRQEEGVEIKTAEYGDGLLVTSVLPVAGIKGERQMLELATVVCVQVLRVLLGEDWKPAKVLFPHPPPQDMTPCRETLGEVVFDADATGVVLTRADLDTPSPDAGLGAAGAIGGGAASDTGMTEVVNDMILQLLPSGRCTADQVARRLGVDRRTIHRRLSAERRSFKALLDDIRRELATRELMEGEATLSVVTSQLGFSSLSTFSRWFRQTYGIQPSEFRRLAHDT